MKRIVSLFCIVLFLLSFASCQTKSQEKIRVYTLNGTTGFGIAKLMDDHKEDVDAYEFFVESDASVVTAALINGSADFACLPTNAAANIYNKTDGGIKILAINTKGCLYLLNTTENEIKSFQDLEGKTIYAPSQNPTFILKYLCETLKVNVTIDNQYAAASDLKDAVAAGKVDYAVLPEPMVTIAIAAGNKVGKTIHNCFSLTDIWDTIDGMEGSLVQGCIVVRTEFLEKNPDTVKKFMEEYKASVSFVNEDVKTVAEKIVSAGIFTNAGVAEKAIPNCSIAYMDGEAMKTAMENYLKVLYGINPQSIGGKIPDEEFYY